MCVLDFLQQLGALPGDHVFEPRRIVFLERLRRGGCRNGRRCGRDDRPKGGRPADLLANDGHEIRHQLGAFFGDLDAGEHVLLAGAHGEFDAGGIGERAGDVLDEIDAEVHFEPGEALLFALLQALAVYLRVVRFGGVGVAADLIAKFAAEHLVNGDVVGFSGQIPEGHFDGADASALARMKAKLFDFAENFVDIAGVFAQNAALQHERVGLGCAVADFAQTVDALVGVDADDRTSHRRAGKSGDSQVGNFEFGGLGCSVGMLHHGIQGIAAPDGGGADTGRAT